MCPSNKGSEHIRACPESTNKYDGSRKKAISRPKSGVKPLAERMPKAAQPARRTSTPAFGRYP